MHQSLTGSSIYLSGRAPQRTTTTECTPMLYIVLYQRVWGLICLCPMKKYSCLYQEGFEFEERRIMQGLNTAGADWSKIL